MEPNQPTIITNFHDVVTAQVYTEDRRVKEFFSSEFGNHLTTAVPSNLPTVQLHYKLNNVFNRTKTGYTHYTHKVLARWQYRIQLSKDKIRIDVIGNLMAVPMVHHMLLHHSLRYLAANQGVLMLHAGAVSKNGKSVIITGSGGAGKTTTTSQVLAYGEKGWKIHADDYTFLTPTPSSLAYLTRAHLYRDLIRLVPEAGQSLSTSELMGLQLFGAIRRMSNDRLKWAVRLPLQRLWPDRELELSAVPTAIVFLNKGAKSTPVLTKIEDVASLVEILIEMNFHEAQKFVDLINLSHTIPDLSAWTNEWKDIEHRLLSKILDQTPAYMLSLPNRTTQSDLPQQDVPKILEGLVMDG